MKQLTMIFAALLFALFATAQPPAPELLYRQTEPNPAFIKVAGITADFADSEDYVFVYSATTNRCYGSTKLYSDPVFVVAMGNDHPSGVHGFAFHEKMNVGIYDTQTGRFYKLEGQAYNYINNNETTLTWSPLQIYSYEVTQVAGEAELMIDKELSAVKLALLAPDAVKIKETNQVFITVSEQNVQNVDVSTNGNGAFTKTKRWITGQGWAQYQYTISDADISAVTFTANAESVWNRSIVTATHQVAIDREIYNQNQGIVYTGKYFSIVKDVGGLYLETTTNKGVMLIYKLNNKTADAKVHNARTQPGDRTLITADDPAEIYLFGVRYMGTKSSRQYIDDGQPGSYWSRVEYIKETIKLK